MKIGVLSFHGDFAEHISVLTALKVQSMEVRTLEDLEQVDRLIIPGGESTVIAKFLQMTGMDRVIRKRVAKGKLAVYGTCAGAILVAAKAKGKNAPSSLGLINIVVERNAYGSQMQSFEAALKVKGIAESVNGSFIRAPIITKAGRGVEVLSMHDGKPVLVRQGRVLAGTFHPETRGEIAIHKLFLSL
ncbi:MAG: pyridoxal 5'-phosphate synthase glutaminase subunit PdxT [Candidatus Peribacteraceae bacterium]|nr:pyridoxal 5'-phosphate synthase glutaminase subunit PdxT [Candidatus Peribacteraceae bacterium]